jgi:Domain of unknown function (DUF4160)
MPRLIRFSNCEIAMFFGDHNPPHFHVLAREGAAQVRIDSLEVINISGKIDMREALDWAAENGEMLMAKWEEFSGDAA